jgi:hypothetical protein
MAMRLDCLNFPKEEKIMAQKFPVFQVPISDRPGSLYKFLIATAEAGVDLACLSAVSKGAGKGEVYLAAKDPRAARKFFKSEKMKVKELAGFALDHKDQCGAGASALKPLAEKKSRDLPASPARWARGAVRLFSWWIRRMP